MTTVKAGLTEFDLGAMNGIDHYSFIPKSEAMEANDKYVKSVFVFEDFPLGGWKKKKRKRKTRRSKRRRKS